jgi:hypothetical protein
VQSSQGSVGVRKARRADEVLASVVFFWEDLAPEHGSSLEPAAQLQAPAGAPVALGAPAGAAIEVALSYMPDRSATIGASLPAHCSVARLTASVASHALRRRRLPAPSHTSSPHGSRAIEAQ